MTDSERIKKNSDWVIDGKDAKEEDFIAIYQRQSLNRQVGFFNLNPAKVEYFGDNESSIRVVEDYNRVASFYTKDGDLKEGYMMAVISKAFNDFSFVKFGNAFRKHIDKYFNAKYKMAERNTSMGWSEVASYIIGDGGYYIEKEDDFRGFAKELGIKVADKKYAKGSTIKSEEEIEDAIRFLHYWNAGEKISDEKLNFIRGVVNKYGDSNLKKKYGDFGKKFITKKEEISELHFELQNMISENKYAKGGSLVGKETSLSFYGDNLKYIQHDNKVYKPYNFTDKMAKAKKKLENDTDIILPYENVKSMGVWYVLYKEVKQNLMAQGGNTNAYNYSIGGL